MSVFSVPKWLVSINVITICPDHPDSCSRAEGKCAILKTRLFFKASAQELTIERSNWCVDWLRVENSFASGSIIGSAQRQDDSIIITLLAGVI